MFILTTIADVIQIEPSDFNKPSAQALEDNINEKYANKVIQKVGLCICFYDFLSASEGLIGHGEGSVNVKVEFRLIIFRPFKGEIIEGKIAEATPLGLRIHMDFFDDIFNPPGNLFDKSVFNEREKTFIWLNEDAESKEFYFDKNERVRFRIEEEIWIDLAADEEEGKDLGIVALMYAGHNQQNNAANGDKEQSRKKPAWSLVVSMAQGGLGCVLWW